jgi:hemerythrin-like domain-containing protein
MGTRTGRGIGRRELLRLGLVAGAGLAVPGWAGEARAAATAARKGAGVTANEDLMQEHGAIVRLLLVYAEAVKRMQAGLPAPLAVVGQAAELIRRFAEDYHERMEEEHVFPRLEQAGGELAVLARVLRVQHDAGRKLTDRIMEWSKAPDEPVLRKDLSRHLTMFADMYLAHISREDTVAFPAFRKLVTAKEYAAVGEKFEARERQALGEDGFGRVVRSIFGLETDLGIYDLARFTPPV